MFLFHNDYSEGCHPKILQKLIESNLEQTPGYGEDHYCLRAAEKIKAACGRSDVSVHFMVGGTQTNFSVIKASLRPHQGVISADSGHINVHETGAVEATGHKVLALPSVDGKIRADQVEQVVYEHLHNGATEHTVQPKMVYISNPTELGTLYTLRELEELSRACRKNKLFLFLDGARLGYGLEATGNDLTLPDIARLCDVFYIGGTKVGAMFGEAVVIGNETIAEDFRYMIKQNGAMLAKGRLLGIQFDTLFTDRLYFEISRYADSLADQIRSTLAQLNVKMLVQSTTNQIFPILPDEALEKLSQDFTFTEQERVDETSRAVRFCTSWASKQENVDALCAALKKVLG